MTVDARVPGNSAEQSMNTEARTIAGELDAATRRYEAEHPHDLVVIDTNNVTELRRRHPGLFSDCTPAEVIACYARQADELAALVEQYDAAHDRHMRVLLHALGDLHVAMDELATSLDQPPAGMPL
jgi:hypothetical protein